MLGVMLKKDPGRSNRHFREVFELIEHHIALFELDHDLVHHFSLSGLFEHVLLFELHHFIRNLGFFGGILIEQAGHGVLLRLDNHLLLLRDFHRFE